MRLTQALTALPKKLLVDSLGGGPQVLDLEVLEPKLITDLTEEYSIVARAKNGNAGTVVVHIPKITDESCRAYEWRSNEYIGIILLGRPVVTIGLNRFEKREIVLHGIHPDQRDIALSTGKDDKTLMMRLPDAPARALQVNHSTFRNFVLRRQDRADFNKLTGSEENVSFITEKDVLTLKNLYFNHPDLWIGWKELRMMRALTLEEMLGFIIRLRLPGALFSVYMKSKTRSDIVQAGVDQWLGTSPQCQLIQNNTEIARFALASKLVVPLKRFDGAEEARPDPSWRGAICPVDTPQSSKAGRVAALADGAKVEGGRLIPGPHMLSPILRRHPFPQHIDMRREVMNSAIFKQCVPLGRDGQNEELPWIVPIGTSHIPELKGRHGLLMLSDFGWTHEDGCVISESFSKLLITYETKRVSFTTPDKPMEVLVGPGDEVRYQTIMGKSWQSKDAVGEQDTELQHKDGKLRVFRNPSLLPGKVLGVSTRSEMRDNLQVFVTTFSVEVPYYCSQGSKLCGLHSNKTIVSGILRDRDMPHVWIGHRRRVVDMILSPMTLGNRMNPSLLLEGMLNMSMMLNRESGEPALRLRVKHWDTETDYWDMAMEGLRSVGLPTSCRFRFTRTADGEEAPHQAFIAPAFMMRLKHHAPDKLRIGADVPEDFRGVQRRGAGPQRVNREEVEALYAWGAHGILQEIESNMLQSGTPERTDEYLRCLGLWRVEGR